jgi:hypothetical protein
VDLSFLSQYINIYIYTQGGSNMTGTNCDLFTHKSSRSYLNHLVYIYTYIYVYTYICIYSYMCVYIYKVVQIWLRQTVTCLHTNSPGHIWTTLYIYIHIYVYIYIRWFKYDCDKLWLVYTQIVPVIFEPPCVYIYIYMWKAWVEYVNLCKIHRILIYIIVWHPANCAFSTKQYNLAEWECCWTTGE